MSDGNAIVQKIGWGIAICGVLYTFFTMKDWAGLSLGLATDLWIGGAIIVTGLGTVGYDVQAKRERRVRYIKKLACPLCGSPFKPHPGWAGWWLCSQSGLNDPRLDPTKPPCSLDAFEE
jgi:hypothetical protein